MSLLRKDIDNLNDEIKDWTNHTQSELKSNINSLGIKHYSYSRNPLPLAQALKATIRKKHDVTDRISFKMPRSAIFLHKGVSRGHGKNNPRAAKEWFNPIVDKNMDQLGNIVANNLGNYIVNNLNIK